MATTTNYSWTTPDDTDLVKDGASAIRTLGSSIDTTVFNNAGAAVAKSTIDAKGDLLVGTADDTVGRLAVGTDGYTLVADSVETTGLKWAAPATPASGLTLISSTAIGTTVSSVTVTGAFSATYDSYKVIVTGDTASTANALNLTLGATSTGYYRFYLLGAYNSATVTGENVSNGSNWSDITRHSTTSVLGEFDLYSPFLSKNTMIYKFAAQPSTTGTIFLGGGYLNDTTSYTAFTLTTAAGTVSGGNIRVYGYQNS
jgi:hypothetical protein